MILLQPAADSDHKIKECDYCIFVKEQDQQLCCAIFISLPYLLLLQHFTANHQVVTIQFHYLVVEHLI